MIAEPASSTTGPVAAVPTEALLAAELDRAMDQLTSATKARDEFLTNLSHEMRTPLNGVLGMLELLEPHVHGDQACGFLTSARQSADDLLQLVTRLLYLVEVRTGRITPVATDTTVDSLIASISDRWQQQGLRSGHLIVVGRSGPVRNNLKLDEGLVLEIVGELIGNACLHADPGLVEVMIAMAVDDQPIESVNQLGATNAARVTVSVVDSGPGVDDDALDRVMEDLTVVDASPSRSVSTLGLGLGVSRRLAEALGGRLGLSRVERLGGGSATKATLEIPAYVPVGEELNQ